MSLDFGEALKVLKQGGRVARQNWNGKGMWLTLSQGYVDLPTEKVWSENNKRVAEANGGSVTILPHIQMKTVQNEIVAWLASQTDLLAEDWFVVED